MLDWRTLSRAHQQLDNIINRNTLKHKEDMKSKQNRLSVILKMENNGSKNKLPRLQLNLHAVYAVLEIFRKLYGHGQKSRLLTAGS